MINYNSDALLNSWDALSSTMDNFSDKNKNDNNSESLPKGYNENDIKWRSEGFIVFKDNTHVHHIPLLAPIKNDIDKSNIANDTDKDNLNQGNKGKRKNANKKSRYSTTNSDKIRNYIILNKLLILKKKLPQLLSHIKINSNSIHNVLPLMIHTEDNVGLNERFRHNGKPSAVVNDKSAIGLNQLSEIKELSYRIKKSLNEPSHTQKSNIIDGSYNKNANRKNVNKNNNDYQILKFNLRYGKFLDYIGSGSFGIIKVYVKNIDDRDVSKLSKDKDDNMAKRKQYKKTKIFDDNIEEKDDITFKFKHKKYFAVKEFRYRQDQDDIDKYCARVISEFIIGHSLLGKSLHLLNVLNLIETKEQKILQVMECCPSIDLYYYIRRCGRLDHIKTLEADCFMKQVLQGLYAMHYHGVAHCDIKLENILFYPNGLLKIADFGSSSVFQTAWETKVYYQQHLIGSKPYLAPEEFKDNFKYDPRITDCWSCGILYMIMIHGKFMWPRAKLHDNKSYGLFYNTMHKNGSWEKLENTYHVNAKLTKLRKEALYKVFQIEPSNRYNVRELLESEWMSQTICCQDDNIYFKKKGIVIK